MPWSFLWEDCCLESRAPRWIHLHHHSDTPVDLAAHTQSLHHPYPKRLPCPRDIVKMLVAFAAVVETAFVLIAPVPVLVVDAVYAAVFVLVTIVAFYTWIDLCSSIMD